jgi:hypothetical protein
MDMAVEFSKIGFVFLIPAAGLFILTDPFMLHKVAPVKNFFSV